MHRPFVKALVLLALLAPASAQPASTASHVRPGRARPARQRLPRVIASPLFEQLRFRHLADDRVSPEALAAFGNRLIARRGLNYLFDACEIVAANRNPRPAPDQSETARAYAYALDRAGGGRVSLLFVADPGIEGDGTPCAGCFFEVPALGVAEDELTVVSGAGRFRVKRPRAFRLDEVSLVDDSMRRTLRRWPLPYETTPLGLSADRTRLYVPLPDFKEGWDARLALELSAAGARLVARRSLALTTVAPPVDALEVPTHGGHSFLRFGRGARSYVIRVAHPCP